jgi:hypothetical protein
MASSKSRLFSALQSFGEEITAEKAAAAARTKVAGPTPSDPGGYQGGTDHPTADADNRGQAASEGARSSENEKDVKDDQGAPSVNNAPMASPGDNKDKSLNLGTQASLTGEDPSVEDDYKGNKDDPGTTAEATTEDGEKYGSVSFKVAHAKAAELADSILADLALQLPLDGRAAKTAAAPAAPAAPVAPAAAAPAANAEVAGYELAAGLGLTKDAAEANVRASIEQTILDAQLDAELFGGYYKKAADDEEGQSEGEDNSKPSDKGSGAGPGSDASGDAPGGGGGEGGMMPAGGGAGGGAPPGLEALMGGAGGGGAEPGIAAQPPGPDEALQELAMALQELGIPVEALAAAAGGGGAPMGADPAAAAGGMPGGMPGGAGGAGGMPPADPMAAMGPKLAAAVTAFKRSGKFQFKEARTARSRELRDVMKAHVLELVGNG